MLLYEGFFESVFDLLTGILTCTDITLPIIFFIVLDVFFSIFRPKGLK